ncbi:cupin domain-containing protein [Stappia stellulata]|uniref:cupin domain-containing protein n=1 Tax=Stappia stellulata TaxID=71235 RepID=UPI000491E316|nr:cupin [Stappia stellulata]
MSGPHQLTPAEVERGRTNDRIGTRRVHATAGFSLWHIRLQPGETLPAHRHDRPYIWTVLSDGKARARRDDGTVTKVSYRAGDTTHHSQLSPETAFVHDLTNTGSAELVFVTIEFNREGSHS